MRVGLPHEPAFRQAVGSSRPRAVSPEPFRQGRFEDLPERPRVPHPYFEVASRTVEVASTDFGRIDVHVREHGEGPPLLLVHGLMTSSYSFRYVLGALGERWRCIVIDLPGSGRSGKPDRSYGARA